jgi:hypothetical protein
MAKIRPAKQLTGGCLSLFGLPFLAAGLFISGLYFSGFAKWWSARGWEEVPCRIESAELKVSSGDDSDTYQALATYRYEYEGRGYRGGRVSFHSGGDNIGGFQHNAHAELARAAADGTPFRCYVNPANPAEAVLYRTLRWQMQAFLAIFALSFPPAGAGLVCGGLLAMRAMRREAALRERHPGEPWKWKTAWAQSTIPENAARWSGAPHLYTLWSGLVIVPLIAGAAAAGAFQESGAAWLLLIFAALWAIPASFSIKRLRHRLAVGSARFEPKETPARPGGKLDGAILLEKPPPLRGSAEVSLTCEKSVTTGTGDNRSTSTETIWSARQSVPQDMIMRDLSGFRVPASFTLPADAPESDSGGDSGTKHVWKLHFKVSDSAIHSVFEVPVFRTGTSPLMENTPSIHDAASADH